MKKNNKFFEKNKIYLIIGVLLIAWICFIVFIVYPSVKLLRNNFDSVQMKMINAEYNDSKLGKLSILRDGFEKVNKERGNLDVIFYKNNIVSLVKELEFVAQKTGNDIVISVDENNKKIQEVGKNKSNNKENELLKLLPAENYFTIKISLVGNYNSLIKFVDKLNNMRYYNTIISFQIDSKEIVVKEVVDNINGEFGNVIDATSGDSNMRNNLSEEERKKLVLNSELTVIFYSLEKNNGTK